jgi:2-C-methyl-D-erythritol 4-phosphate cytidylyltransferase
MIWCVIPAAGRGARFGADRPKQFLPVLGRPLIEWTLDRIATHPSIGGIVLVMAGDESVWRAPARWCEKPLLRASGGAERADSVLAGLNAVPPQCAASDWVLVHDAARPCVRHTDLDRLLEGGRRSAHGAILAAPVRDTIKRGTPAGRIDATVSRVNLWRALTPQMARRGQLTAALVRAMENGSSAVTDEAYALELAGFSPLLVEGYDDNLKLTSASDRVLVEAVLRAQGC